MPDPNILFKLNPTSSPNEQFQNALIGAQNFNNFRNNEIQSPIRNRLLEQEAALNEQAIEQGQVQANNSLDDRQRALAVQKAKVMKDLYSNLKGVPLERRKQVLSNALPELQKFGINLPFEKLQQTEFTDDLLNEGIAQADAIAGSVGGGGITEFQKRSLELQEKRLNQPTANERDLKTYQRLRKENPEDAKAFARDVGLLPEEDKLSSTAEKALIQAQDSYFKGQKDAREYQLLADDFQRNIAQLPSGASYTMQEFMKSVTGSQDEFTELRRRFNTVRLSEALVNLPPGPATDRDVQEAFKGVPKENASPQQVISFLRGAAKLKALDNEFNLFKADYISDNNNTKGLLKAWGEKMRSGEVEALSLFDNRQAKSEVETLSDDELLNF